VIALAVTLALGASLGFIAKASAQGTTVEKSVQINALGDASWCESGNGGETCYEAHLDIADPGKFGGVVACLSLTSSGPNGETFEEGCADVADAFVLDPKDLSSASLAATPIDLLVNVCDPETNECDIVFSRTVSLGATWVAVGETQKIPGRIEDPQNNCVTHTKIKGLIQNATATLVIDGVRHEGDGNLQVLDVLDRTHCTNP
jgi:hypothetical protein